MYTYMYVQIIKSNQNFFSSLPRMLCCVCMKKFRQMVFLLGDTEEFVGGVL